MMKRTSFFFFLVLVLEDAVGFPGGSVVKNPLASTGDGRDACLENPMDKEAWWATSMWLQRVGQDWGTDTS